MINCLSDALDRTFAALSHPARRALLARLGEEDGMTVSDLARPLPMSLPAVMKHLDVLSEAGLVTRRKAGRVVTCRDEGVGDGECGQDVSGGPPAGHDRVGPIGHLALIRLATLNNSPAAVMLTKSELPPAEKNGSVRPVTGRKPTTPPMLTIA